jgi:hypothetical protein
MRPLSIPLVLLVALGACDRKQPTLATTASAAAPGPAVSPRDAAIKSFWQWFVRNAATLHADENLVGVMNRITAEIKKVDRDLIAEISSLKDDRTLILSADGERKLFPVVMALYAARPSVTGWKIVAFRQRTPATELKGVEFEMNGKKYSPFAISFVAARNGDKLDIALFSPTEYVSDDIKRMLFVMLDHVIGEYDSETKISGIDFLPKSRTAKAARPLPALAQLLDETFSPRK